MAYWSHEAVYLLRRLLSHVSYSLNSLKGGSMVFTQGSFLGVIKRAYKRRLYSVSAGQVLRPESTRDTRSLPDPTHLRL